MTDTWTAEDVCGLDLPAHSVRTYLEQTDLRRSLRHTAQLLPLRRLADIGAGFGRLSPVLAEFGETTAFEREPAMVERARFLLPDIHWCQVERLDRLPVPDGAFELAMCFTVLQHLTDSHVVAVARELRRIVGPAGGVLLCEEIDPSHQWRAAPPDTRFTIGRPVAAYEELMTPLRLVEQWPRRVEPAGPERIPGAEAYLLFIG